MASLPPALDFSKMEEAICEKWEKEGAFQAQDRLAQERGDEVSLRELSSIFALLLHCIHLRYVRRSHRNSPFTMGPLLPPGCRITVTFWLVLLKIPSLGMLP